MSSSQALYSITIANGNTTTAPHDGFVDNLTIENYYGTAGTSLETAPSGLDVALCKAKVRANLRFREIINQLSIVSNCYIASKAGVTTPNVTSDATAKTEATSFAFWIIVEHGDASLSTPDEFNAGQFLTSTNCIKRCVARALLNDMLRQVAYFDPTATSGGSETWAASVSTGCAGIQIVNNAFECAAYATNLANANAQITVAKVTF